jgi:hypothetical protein
MPTRGNACNPDRPPSAGQTLAAGLAVAAVCLAGGVTAEPLTVTGHDGRPREIRCGTDVQTTAPQTLRLTREQCLLIGTVTPVLPEATAGSRRETAFEAMESRSGLGRPIPAATEVAPLPGPVTEQFPELAQYRYFVTTDDIALVDPATRTVVALVEVHIRPERARSKRGFGTAVEVSPRLASLA